MHGAILKSKVLITVICLLVIVTGIYLVNTGAPVPDKKITINYKFSVLNTTKQPIKHARVATFGPVLQTGTQVCADLKVSQPCLFSKDNLGNQLIAIDWDVFPPFSTKIIHVSSRIHVWNKPRKGRFSLSEDDLKSEPLIESDNILIRNQAKLLKMNTPIETARAVFKWVSVNMSYSGYTRSCRGALYAIKHRKGDCSEYAALFAALCRANGIPARLVGGFVCPDSSIVDAGDYHNWAEFYISGRWYPADPQQGRFMQNSSDYIAFQIIRNSNNHAGFLIPEIEGAGLIVSSGT